MTAAICRRSWAACRFAVALFLMATGVRSAEENVDRRIPSLIRQLGDDSFAEREAATTELTVIGEPALDALRTATSDHDPEIRWRAEWIIETVLLRMELAKLQGSWKNSDGVWMTVTGDRWSSGTPTFGPVGGRLLIRERRETTTMIDFLVEEGPTKGQTCLTIFRLEKDTLHYCGTYDSTRPTEFKTVGGWYSCVLSRERSLPPPQDVRENVTP